MVLIKRVNSMEIQEKKAPSLSFPEFQNNEGWVMKRLGEVAKVKNGYAFKSNSYSKFGKYKIITISNVKSGYLDMTGNNYLTTIPQDIQPHQILKRGDILISMTGNVGRVCKVDCDDCLLNQRVGLIDIVSYEVDKDFIYTVLSSTAFEQSMIFSGQGAAQANIGNKDIEGFCFFCPSSIDEQRKIASCFSSLNKMIKACSDKATLLDLCKKGLMQQMFPTSK